MAIAPLLIGCAVLLATGRALILGAASAGGDGITQEDDPIFYSACVAGGLGWAAFLFYVSLSG